MRITSVEVAPWKDNATFVYSVVFDEGTLDCLANAFPLGQQYGIPGDVAVVAGQLGEKRHVERSSLNDYFHMGPEHLKFLLSQGWSISNHSYSHPPSAGTGQHRLRTRDRGLLPRAGARARTAGTGLLIVEQL